MKNCPQRRVFHDVNLSNLESVLQRNLRTDRAWEWIFKVFGCTDFGNICPRHQQWWHIHGFDACTHLPKKTLDMSLWTLTYEVLPNSFKATLMDKFSHGFNFNMDLIRGLEKYLRWFIFATYQNSELTIAKYRGFT